MTRDRQTWPGMAYCADDVLGFLEGEPYELRAQIVELADGQVVLVTRPDGWWSLSQGRALSHHDGAADGTIGLPVFTAQLAAYDHPGELAAAVYSIVCAAPENRAALAELEGPCTGRPTVAMHLAAGHSIEFWADGAMTRGEVTQAHGNGRGGINLTLRTADGVTHQRCWHRLEEV